MSASNAQARLLACLESHGDEDVLAVAYDYYTTLVVARDDHGPLYGVDYFVRIDPSLVALVPASLPHARTATVRACARHGWIIAGHQTTLTSQRLGTCWTADEREYKLQPLALTEDGMIALGIWRQRVAALPEPVLSEREREVVAASVQAARLGYVLVPMTDEARAEARRMARGPWVARDFVGISARSLVPTATGEMEIIEGSAA